MKKSTLIWLITASCLTAVGVIMMIVVMSIYKWDFTKLSTTEYKSTTYDITGEVTDITISADTEDITFIPCDGENARVECIEPEKINHSVTLDNGKLRIGVKDDREWYEYIGLFLGNTKITVYLPAGEYGDLAIKNSTGDMSVPKDYSFKSIDIKGSTGDLDCSSFVSGPIKVKLSTGDITIKSISAEKLDLSVSTGTVRVSGIACEGEISLDVSTGNADLKNISCRKLNSTGSTGNVYLKNFIATGNIYIKRSTGGITLNKCDAKSLDLTTSTGDITGSLLSKKVYLTDTSIGRVSVPKTTEGGKCKVKTSTGDIIFR